MCDPVGRCYDCVLGGVEIAEVYSGDYKVWMTEGTVGGGAVVHSLFVVKNYQWTEAERTAAGAGRSWMGGRKGVGITPPFPYKLGSLKASKCLL